MSHVSITLTQVAQLSIGDLSVESIFFCEQSYFCFYSLQRRLGCNIRTVVKPLLMEITFHDPPELVFGVLLVALQYLTPAWQSLA